MTGQRSAKADPRKHILDVAIRLFAERGLDAVSVRDITNVARVNLGAMNYYFGSKEALIHEIFETLLGPLQRRRLALLGEIEAQAGKNPPSLELVLRALIEPTVQFAVGQEGPPTYLPRLMFQAYAVSRPFLDDKLAEQSDDVAKRFINALAQAVPGISHEEACWRYYLIVGGFLQVISDSQSLQRLRRLSDGRCDMEDIDRMIEQMIVFFWRGMTAPAPRKSRRRKHPRGRALPARSGTRGLPVGRLER